MAVTDTTSEATPPGVVEPSEDKLNLGCGDDIRTGWRNADISESVSADDYFDMADVPWPYPADSFSHVLAKHSFEHLAHEDVVAVFHEVGRILEPGGTLEVRVPFGADDRTDTSHRSTWDWLTPERFTREGEYSWETGCLPFELEGKDANAWVQPPPGFVSQLRWKLGFEVAFRRHGPGRWITGYPFVSGEIIATYRRVEL